jgi:uncharacterized protein with PhoU and TrkA domain
MIPSISRILSADEVVAEINQASLAAKLVQAAEEMVAIAGVALTVKGCSTMANDGASSPLHYLSVRDLVRVRFLCCQREMV